MTSGSEIARSRTLAIRPTPRCLPDVAAPLCRIWTGREDNGREVDPKRHDTPRDARIYDMAQHVLDGSAGRGTRSRAPTLLEDVHGGAPIHGASSAVRD